MYEKVFQLDSRPFVSTPDVERFYSARVVHQALSKACSTIDRASGTVIVIGPTGAGKTLFLNMIEDQFRTVYRVVNLACARLAERQDLLQNILFELNQPYLNMSEGELRLALIDFLKPGVECPNGILLLVDDAHLLNSALFDEIRLLTNLVRDGQPRAQLVLAGNMRLEETLMDSSLESFNQRIAARCYLENFTASETEGYIFSAIARTGGLGNEIFTLDGIEAVYEVSEGCPRLVNQVCDHAMILAASTKTTSIDAACIHEAWADVQHMPNSWAEVATQTMQGREENATEVEFGSLDDDSSFVIEHHVVEDQVVQEFDSESVVEQHEEVVIHETLESTEDDGQWNEIEFGRLDEEESGQLASLSEYEEITETIEVSYKLEQVIEPASTIPSCNQFDDEGVDNDVDEYQLAPPETVVDTAPIVESFPSLTESVRDEPSAIQDGRVNVDDYVDVRFRDLAQFLTNGGVLESGEVVDEQLDDEELDVKDQMVIQNELNEVFEQDQTVVEQHLVENDLDESELDAQLNEIMQTQTTPEIKVFQADEESEAEVESPKQSWKDLFSEPFEQEELVHDPYTALVVEQNTNALSLTRVELSVLEDNQQTDPLDVEQIEEVAEAEPMETLDEAHSEEVEHEEPADEAIEQPEQEPVSEMAVVDGQDLLDTIQRQQAEIADQIFKLKKDLAGTGVVQVNGLEAQAAATPQEFTESLLDGDETGVKLETPLESVDNDDRDILVITRVEQHEAAKKRQELDSSANETPVSKGRAVRMEYSQLFKQLRAAE